jgi:diguanylate cyclase (GGDEF)-like protein
MSSTPRRPVPHSPAEVQLSEKTLELARLTRHLELLHSLTTTSHPSLEQLFSRYLAAGCEIFAVEQGQITNFSADGVRSHGAPILDKHAIRIAKEASTLICGGAQDEYECGHQLYIGAPIFVDGNLFGTLGFWTETAEQAALHPQAREIIELMARGIGSAIHQKNLTDQLAYQALHDSLTALPNRLLLHQRLDAAIEQAAATSSTLAVAFIDLDRFKQINDTLGHAIGDEVLRIVARRLEACLVPGETLARMGGDEFTAILPGVSDEAEALYRARELLGAVHAPCKVEEYELFATASIGISFYPRDGASGAALLRNADIAMYDAKYRGKNDVSCYEPSSTAKALNQLSLETNLRRALERDELSVRYQPQVQLNGSLAGFEALALWNHPKLGKIGPAQFIPVAEETGMILQIGQWVLRTACEQMVTWRELTGDSDLVVAVNVSAVQLAQAHFVESVGRILDETGLPASTLELELTESLLMRDFEQCSEMIRSLRRLGVRIAIDDFGTGYSSLSYLRQLPADTLKIDRSFIRDAASAPAVLGAIVVLGHSFGMLVAAEGIETEEELEIAKQAGVDRAQGHLFGIPLEMEEARIVLLSQRVPRNSVSDRQR